MSGKMSRNKGQRGEREFIGILQRVIDEVFGEGVYELKRNLFQTREGGYDVTGLPEQYDLIAFEVKFQETLNIESWWKQTVEQAGDKAPVLAFRQSRKKWRIMINGLVPWISYGEKTWLRGGHACRVEISLQDFIWWYDMMLRNKREI